MRKLLLVDVATTVFTDENGVLTSRQVVIEKDAVVYLNGRYHKRKDGASLLTAEEKEEFTKGRVTYLCNIRCFGQPFELVKFSLWEKLLAKFYKTEDLYYANIEKVEFNVGGAVFDYSYVQINAVVKPTDDGGYQLIADGSVVCDYPQLRKGAVFYKPKQGEPFDKYFLVTAIRPLCAEPKIDGPIIGVNRFTGKVRVRNK